MFDINLDDLAGGELGIQFQAAAKKVIENLLDPNTPYKNKRGITIKLTFEQNEGSEAVLRFAGTIESGTLAAYSDDGISQSATVKKGIAGKESALVPNPVKLRPYRTFIEVQQPESEFIFRMKDYDGEIGCAIFEADGGAWKREAMKNIKEYLEFELADLAPQFTVIS